VATVGESGGDPVGKLASGGWIGGPGGRVEDAMDLGLKRTPGGLGAAAERFMRGGVEVADEQVGHGAVLPGIISLRYRNDTIASSWGGMAHPLFAPEFCKSTARNPRIETNFVCEEKFSQNAQSSSMNRNVLFKFSQVFELVKRRLKDAGLPERLSPHSFRVSAITDLLTQGVPLEDVQYLAGHAEPRTTGLYDRRQKKVTRNIVERISI
jgi:Phage integrase family